MRRQQTGLLVGFAVLVMAACSSNPMPGEKGYPYNMTGIYETSVEALGTVYAGPAEIATSPGGLIYGKLQLDGPKRWSVTWRGTIVGRHAELGVALRASRGLHRGDQRQRPHRGRWRFGERRCSGGRRLCRRHVRRPVQHDLEDRLTSRGGRRDSMGDLSGKRAVVCGSTQGIGRACAEELAGRGADVVLVARNEAALREVTASLATPHGEAHSWVRADFSDVEEVRRNVARAPRADRSGSDPGEQHGWPAAWPTDRGHARGLSEGHLGARGLRTGPGSDDAAGNARRGVWQGDQHRQHFGDRPDPRTRGVQHHQGGRGQLGSHAGPRTRPAGCYGEHHPSRVHGDGTARGPGGIDRFGGRNVGRAGGGRLAGRDSTCGG